MVVVAAKTPPLRASIWPVGLKRPAMARPVKADCGPRERPTLELLSAVEGVASHSAVKFPAWVGMVPLIQLLPSCSMQAPLRELMMRSAGAVWVTEPSVAEMVMG